MPEIPASWVTIITLVFGAIVTAIGWAFNNKQKEVDRLNDLNKFLYEKLEQRNLERIEELKETKIEADRRRELDERMASLLFDLRKRLDGRP